MSIENLKQKAIYGLVAGLVYALVLITIDHFFNEEILWNKITIKAIVFAIILTIILHFTQSKKKK